MSGNILVPYNGPDRDEEISPPDLSWARLENDKIGLCPDRNYVPDPADDMRLRPLKRCLSEDEVLERFEAQEQIPVYKIGQTSGLTSGYLEFGFSSLRVVDVRGTPHLYDEVAFVTPDKDYFSIPGDSGAIVYTTDFYGLGFVVGGTSKYGMIQLASKALEYFDNVEPLT